ncbi:uncharacterized protein NPIL_220761 [Nephila pilipes]|uniref:LRRCT domain-containing protein n=1 Tax=Nephila pilipes TaxID=299642 RepID=A0A8X6NIE5_NEPPI|nr:uncharacterized protein NPIL_220761 [Nephila pilipes]
MKRKVHKLHRSSARCRRAKRDSEMKDSCLILLVLIGVGWAQCPPESSGSQCKCSFGNFYEGKGTKVECRSVTDPQILHKEIQRFRGYDIDFLKLVQVQLPFLPAGLFSGTSVKRIYIIDSILDNLYSIKNATPSPFDGLDNSLEEIYVQSTRDPSKWYWPEVKNLKNLKKFEIVQSPIDFIGHIFAEIGGGSLESITATYSRVYRIHPQAFPELTNLKEANFAGNMLPYLVRTMFSNPAPQLEKLNFRDNQLFTLPEDMFSNMPALKFLDLSENQFKAFEVNVFTPIWNQLEFFFIKDNPYKCGCSLLPLKEKLISGSLPKHQDFVDVKCKNPGDFKKTKLKDIDNKAFQCE